MRLAFKLGVVVLVGACAVSSCVFPYYMQAIGGQVSLLRKRVPIEQLIQDPGIDATTRQRLELVTQIRAFAVSELKLPESQSYTSYVDLGRDYVVWNVVAAEEFSVEPQTWCFPVAGCVSYRGYFEQANADKFAVRLNDRGLDTYIGGAPAYSTLGHFDDPVLNTMLTGGETNIAATLFHELAHQRLYFKDDTELSESFATAVEQYSVETWLTSRNEHEALAQYRQGVRRQRQFAELVRRQRDRLSAVYGAGTDPETMRAAKSAAFGQMRDEYALLRAEWGGAGNYDRFMAGDLNNASLAALTSYQRWVPVLRSEIDRLGPEGFFEAVEALADLDSAQRAAALESWAAAR